MFGPVAQQHDEHAACAPTSAVLEFDGSDPVHFGRRLNVDSILEGTVVHINKNVRVTARLVRTGDNSTILSGHFEKPLQDEMKLQNEVALQVANALAVGLSSTEVAAAEKRYTSSVDAYRLYVQGRYE